MFIHQIIYRKEISHLEIKISYIFSFLKLQWFLQKFIKFRSQTHQLKYKISYIFIHHISLTFPFVLKKSFVTFIKNLFYFGAIRLYYFPAHQKIFFIYLCTVHLAASLDQIVCLINQENIVSLYTFLKEAF